MKFLIAIAFIVVGLLVACETAGGIAKDLGVANPTPTMVPTTNTVFKVGSRSKYRLNFDISVGSTIEFKFSADLDLNFIIRDPLDNVVYQSDRVFNDEGRVTANRSGRYTLVFDNGFSLFASKNVTIAYRVVPAGGR